HLALAALIGGGLGLPWYGPRLLGLVPEIASRSFRQAAESGHPEPLTGAALTLYPRWFPTQFGLVGVLLFILGLGVAARRRHWLLVASVLPAFVLFELLQNKNLRYTLPLLPVAAVLAGVGFGALPTRVRDGVRVLLVVAGLVQVSATAFGVPHVSVPVLDVPFVVETPPVRADWRQREILALLARDGPGASRGRGTPRPLGRDGARGRARDPRPSRRGRARRRGPGDPAHVRRRHPPGPDRARRAARRTRHRRRPHATERGARARPRPPDRRR